MRLDRGARGQKARAQSDPGSRPVRAVHVRGTCTRLSRLSSSHASRVQPGRALPLVNGPQLSRRLCPPLSLPQSPHLMFNARSISRSRYLLTVSRADLLFGVEHCKSGAHRLEIGQLFLLYDVSPLDGTPPSSPPTPFRHQSHKGSLMRNC
jgi:hypothetical protein